MPPTVRLNAQGWKEFRELVARGTEAVMLDAELEAKRETPVRGAYRSFRPGTKPIGGTLRRSVHSTVFLDGARVGGHSEDGRPPLPDEVGLSGQVVGYVGTNTGYGAFVELGTYKMQARPFLAPGFAKAIARVGATMARAMRRAR